MYGRKRKFPASGFRAQGPAKRFQGRGRTNVFQALPRFGGARRRAFPYRRTAGSVIIRQPSSLPDRLYVKLVYREQLSWTTASGNIGDNVYRGNSIFDPNLTGAGGQPMGADQWANFYYSYTVLGSTIEIESMVNSGTCATQRHGVTPSNLSNAFTSIDGAEELPYTKAVTARMGSANAASGSSSLKSYMSTAKIIGVVRPAVQIEDAFGALTTANPTNTWFWHVWNYVPGGETQSLYQNVKITYFVVYETRTELPQS